ncbi:MAG: CotH kinase family protein [Planctomycetes bacterium]|nr:CotH kinase family protein [Planctomycetota bacterium]
MLRPTAPWLLLCAFPLPGQGPGMRERTELVAQFDQDGNRRLDTDEREAARAWMAENRPQRNRGPGGPGGPGGFGPPGSGPEGEGDPANAEPKVGRKVTPADVQTHLDKPFYDPDVVRTIFLDVPGTDWFDELVAFYRTDVELPVTMTVDGTTYTDVGMRFRGNSSFGGARGKKKSINLTLDFVHQDQHLGGYRTLNLLNAHSDASFLREALHARIVRQYLPAMQANLVRVVINGEDHGIYANVQQFNKDFLDEEFGTGKGARFRVPADFSGNGALVWLGDDVAAYKRAYQLKSKDDPKAWERLADLCRVLAESADAELPQVLPQYLDIDHALWFLACDNALIDGDGYYSRGSDYVLWLDPEDRFHVLPMDSNEVLGAEMGGPGMRGPGGRGPGGAPPDGQRPRAGAFDGAPVPRGGPPDGPGFGPGAPGGPGAGPGGRRGGPGGSNPTQAPLAQLDRQDRPLVNRLLAVPQWRARYLAFVRTLATTGLDWKTHQPQVARWVAAIDDIVANDVHALYGHAQFRTQTADEPTGRTLRAMLAQRQKVLLGDPAMQSAAPVFATAEATESPTETTVALTFTARTSGATRLLAHVADGKLAAWTTLVMHDDGKNGDAKAGDGEFTAATNPLLRSHRIRWWIEAIAEDGTVSCSPPAAGSRPNVRAADRSDKKK